VSTSDALVHVLTRQILDGTLPAGTHLIEIDLADTHGVSRQSLRSALAELVHLGLLEREPHRGVWVPRLTKSQVRDLWDVREMIELEAVRRGTRLGLDWAGLDPVCRRLAALSADSSWADAVEADLAFHRTMVAAVGSPHLSRAHDQLMAEMRLSLAGNVGREAPGYMAGEHQELLDTFRRGDAEASVARLRQHLATGLELVSSPLPEGD
jgi:DNA-binding GntR family transcriptional regulator